ncbi:Pyrimidine 5'-nucleotidase YjjG [compost metagenome]
MRLKYIVFDLDDTLVSELDYLKSAYKEIARTIDETLYQTIYKEMLDWYFGKENTFEQLSRKYGNLDPEQLLILYRNHFPCIALKTGAAELLAFVKSSGNRLGLITDGRSITQRNKLKALNIEHLFDKIIISEEFGSSKPAMRNYEVFIEAGVNDYFYIGDNLKKDFISPNKLGWTTVCLVDSGSNIHDQELDYNDDAKPNFFVKQISEIKQLVINN